MAVPILAASGAPVDNFASATIQVPYPTGIATGHLLLLVLARHATSAIATPSGWTLRASPQSGDVRIWVWSRIATGSESGTVAVNTLNQNDCAIGRIHRFTGANSFEQIGSAGATSKNVGHPAVTTQGVDRLVVTVTSLGINRDALSFTGETGGDLTLRTNHISNQGNDGGLSTQAAPMATAGTISGGTWTYSGPTRSWVTSAFAIFTPSGVEAALTIAAVAALGTSLIGTGNVDATLDGSTTLGSTPGIVSQAAVGLSADAEVISAGGFLGEGEVAIDAVGSLATEEETAKGGVLDVSAASTLTAAVGAAPDADVQLGAVAASDALLEGSAETAVPLGADATIDAQGGALFDETSEIDAVAALPVANTSDATALGDLAADAPIGALGEADVPAEVAVGADAASVTENATGVDADNDLEAVASTLTSATIAQAETDVEVGATATAALVSLGAEGSVEALDLVTASAQETASAQSVGEALLDLAADAPLDVVSSIDAGIEAALAIDAVAALVSLGGPAVDAEVDLDAVAVSVVGGGFSSEAETLIDGEVSFTTDPGEEFGGVIALDADAAAGLADRINQFAVAPLAAQVSLARIAEVDADAVVDLAAVLAMITDGGDIPSIEADFEIIGTWQQPSTGGNWQTITLTGVFK